METTTAGAVATVSIPLGAVQRRAHPAPQVHQPKKKKNAQPRS